MLGFADIEDSDMLTLDDIAERMSFGSSAALRRALKQRGASLPPAILRGKYRGADVKFWYAGLPSNSPPEAQDGNEKQRPPEPSAPAVVVSIQAARKRIKQRLEAG